MPKPDPYFREPYFRYFRSGVLSAFNRDYLV